MSLQCFELSLKVCCICARQGWQGRIYDTERFSQARVFWPRLIARHASQRIDGCKCLIKCRGLGFLGQSPILRRLLLRGISGRDLLLEASVIQLLVLDLERFQRRFPLSLRITFRVGCCEQPILRLWRCIGARCGDGQIFESSRLALLLIGGYALATRIDQALGTSDGIGKALRSACSFLVRLNGLARNRLRAVTDHIEIPVSNLGGNRISQSVLICVDAAQVIGFLKPPHGQSRVSGICLAKCADTVSDVFRRPERSEFSIRSWSRARSRHDVSERRWAAGWLLRSVSDLGQPGGTGKVGRRIRELRCTSRTGSGGNGV